MEGFGSIPTPKDVSIPGELVARLEVATEGSREIDAWIADIFDPAPDQHDGFSGRWPFAPGSEFDAQVPPVTTSLDAALALAERVLPEGWGYRLTRTERGGHHAATLHWSHPVNREAYAEARAAALALCIAILRATTPGNPSSASEGVG